MSESNSMTRIDEIGEFGLIDRITKGNKLKHPESALGPGDDAALVDIGNSQYQVVSTDLLIEGIHFDLVYTPLQHLGYKSVIVNLSDIYAMNATPKQILVSLGISGKFSVEAIEQLYDGIKKACEVYQVDLVGGDTTASMTGLTISITALGTCNQDKITRRSTAKPNDLVCVSGNVGAAYLGLQVLEREKKIFQENKDIQPDLSGFDYVVERFLKPEARKEVPRILELNNIMPTSMIDLSDGISSDLRHICLQSSVGCKIFQDKIPISPETKRVAGELHLEEMIAALNGGEDYELLFTVPVDKHEIIEKTEGISMIGHLTKVEDMLLITSDGREIPLLK